MHAAAAAAKGPTIGLFKSSDPNLYAPYGDNCLIAQTPETYDQLIDFESFSSRTLMNTLKTKVVTDIIINKCLRVGYAYKDKTSSLI